jgi:hypothetical protein
VASPRVSADALRLALHAVSSGSPMSSGLAVDRSRSDRPARTWVCTLTRTTPAAARRVAASVAARVGALDGVGVLALAHGLGAGEVVQRGGLLHHHPLVRRHHHLAGWGLRCRLPLLRSLVGALPRLRPFDLQLGAMDPPWLGRPMSLLLVPRYRRRRLRQRRAWLPSRCHLYRPWVWSVGRRHLPRL